MSLKLIDSISSNKHHCGFRFQPTTMSWVHLETFFLQLKWVFVLRWFKGYLPHHSIPFYSSRRVKIVGFHRKPSFRDDFLNNDWIDTAIGGSRFSLSKHSPNRAIQILSTFSMPSTPSSWQTAPSVTVEKMKFWAFWRTEAHVASFWMYKICSELLLEFICQNLYDKSTHDVQLYWFYIHVLEFVKNHRCYTLNHFSVICIGKIYKRVVFLWISSM